VSRRVCFLDSSAVTKLVVSEPESAALAERLSGQILVGSALLVTEVSRAVRRVLGRSHDDVLAEVLDVIDLVVVDRAVLSTAADLAPAGLRTLDALHLASALALGDRLDVLIAYDDRLLDAARAAGLAVEAPAAESTP
jgi:predicted nucleic acid-binding protein